MKPYWRYPGALNGRIMPTVSMALDGSYVFCLGGDDEEPQTFTLSPGEKVSVEQIIDAGGVDLVYFYFQFRTGPMPAYRMVLNAQSAQIKLGSLATVGDGMVGISIEEPSLLANENLFVQADSDQLAKLSGFPTPANNGVFRISSVPVHDDVYPPGRVAVIENAAAVAEAGPATTIEIYGARWVGQVYIDAVKRVEVVEFTDAGPQRDLAVNISKLVGFHTLKYVLELQSIVTS